jgi:hypothetical protein
MNEFEQNPDEFWRSVFDDAAETPPPRVWDAIERRLDEPDETLVVPLWSTGFLAKRSVSWGLGVAATLALLLVGWWVSTPSDVRTPVASRQTKSGIANPPSSDAVAMRQSVDKRSSISSKQQQRNNTSVSDGLSGQANPSATRLSTVTDQSKTSGQLAQRTRFGSTQSTIAKPSGNGLADAQVNDQVTAYEPSKPTSSVIGLVQSAARSFSADPSTERAGEYSQLVSSTEKLSPRPMKIAGARQIHRIVWMRPHEIAQAPVLAESKRSSHEYWVSLNVMPSAFNPAVSVQAAQPILASAYGFNITNVNQPAVKSQTQLSMAYQANAGLQLNDHWSVESGVGYLAGRATIDSPANPYPASMLSLASATPGMAANTLYTDVLRQSVQRNTNTALADQASGNWARSSTFNSLYAYDPQTRQTLTNDYQFVQVPLQVGYQLRPRKRLGLALLGGFITNIFLRNTVEDQLVIKPEDGVYQPLTLAAAMGARFRYRSSQRWSASLAGMYQPTIGSATKAGSSVQSHPTSTGMSFGVDYHF